MTSTLDEKLERIEKNKATPKVLDLSKEEITIEQLVRLNRSMLSNNILGHVVWGKIPPSTEVIDTDNLVSDINEALSSNNLDHRYYPLDYDFGLLASRVYNNLIEGNLITIDAKKSNEWKVHRIFDYWDEKGYYSVIYKNTEQPWLVVAHRGTNPNSTFMDFFKIGTSLYLDVKFIMRNHFEPSDYKSINEQILIAVAAHSYSYIPIYSDNFRIGSEEIGLLLNEKDELCYKTKIQYEKRFDELSTINSTLYNKITNELKSKKAPLNLNQYEKDLIFRYTLYNNDNVERSGFYLSGTGHSLGAWLNQQFSCFYYKTFDESMRTTVFDSPGISKMFEKMNPGVITNDAVCSINSLDSTIYLSAPNIVNMLHNHIGTALLVSVNITHGIKTQIEEWGNWSWPYLNSFRSIPIIGTIINEFINIEQNFNQAADLTKILHSLEGHSLTTILQNFNKTSGKPEGYYQNKIYQIRDYYPNFDVLENKLVHNEDIIWGTKILLSTFIPYIASNLLSKSLRLIEVVHELTTPPLIHKTTFIFTMFSYLTDLNLISQTTSHLITQATSYIIMPNFVFVELENIVELSYYALVSYVAQSIPEDYQSTEYNVVVQLKNYSIAECIMYTFAYPLYNPVICSLSIITKHVVMHVTSYLLANYVIDKLVNITKNDQIHLGSMELLSSHMNGAFNFSKYFEYYKHLDKDKYYLQFEALEDNIKEHLRENKIYDAAYFNPMVGVFSKATITGEVILALPDEAARSCQHLHKNDNLIKIQFCELSKKYKVVKEENKILMIQGSIEELKNFVKRMLEIIAEYQYEKTTSDIELFAAWREIMESITESRLTTTQGAESEIIEGAESKIITMPNMSTTSDMMGELNISNINQLLYE